jgi:hypothetical protein
MPLNENDLSYIIDIVDCIMDINPERLPHLSPERPASRGLAGAAVEKTRKRIYNRKNHWRFVCRYYK